MGRREERRKRERECIPPVLTALLSRVSTKDDLSAVQRYLQMFATRRRFDRFSTMKESDNSNNDNDDGGGSIVHVIEGEELTKLCKDIGNGASSRDLLALTRRVPRSQSTHERIDVSELCFAIGQAITPVDVHERRRNVGNVFPIDESAPLMMYYKGDRFASLLGSSDSPEQMILKWEKFLQCISTPLPMTLRVHRSERALQHIAQQFLHDGSVSKVLKPVVPLLPFSVGLYGCSHADYHADSRLEYICRTLHAGSAVSFQEAVSVLPVLVADVRPNHTVLDMCAAPGSKTLHILDEMLQHGWTAASASQGVVIVNEKDRVKATQILPARLKRFHAPNAICTRCDAVKWPRLFCPSDNNKDNGNSDGVGYFMEKTFDRIICDVPCSGDGTLRKDATSVSSWSPAYVNSLVPTQKALLRRGLDLLREDGILVYSTCSLNPKEDEEVVCAGLELFSDAVELLDVNAILKERGALVQSVGGVISPDTDGLRADDLPSLYDGRKVLRVLPHHDNTGGFFIAAFRKRSLQAWAPPATLSNKLNQWMKGKIWVPVGRDDAQWNNIAQFYGFDPNCVNAFHYYTVPRREHSKKQEKTDDYTECGLTPVYHLNPNGGPCRRIVLVTPAAAHFMFDTRPYKGPGVEIVSVGVRAFEAYDSKFLTGALCRWRAVVESASYLALFMHARKMVVVAEEHPEFLKELLSNGFVWLLDYWRLILQQAPAAALGSGASFVQSGRPLYKILASAEYTEPSTHELRSMLSEDVSVGGVLLGLCGGKLGNGEEGPWWLSATLSASKLELAVDASLRTFGLLAFFGIDASGTMEQEVASNT